MQMAGPESRTLSKTYAQVHFKAVRCSGSNDNVHTPQIHGFPEELVVWKSHGLKKIKGY